MVNNAWKRDTHHSVVGLTNLKDDSIVFNKEIFGNIWKRKRELEQGVFDKLIPYPLIYLSFAWNVFPMSLCKHLMRVIGSPLDCPAMGLLFPIYFFADDVLLFSKATASQAKLLVETFMNFAKIFRLSVNVAKSRVLFSSMVPRTKKDKIVSITGIRSTISFDKHFGFPMLQGRVRRSNYNFVVEKIQSRPTSWKNKLLNRVRRITLAKSVLNSIQVYYMHICWFFFR